MARVSLSKSLIHTVCVEEIKNKEQITKFSYRKERERERTDKISFFFFSFVRLLAALSIYGCGPLCDEREKVRVRRLKDVSEIY